MFYGRPGLGFIAGAVLFLVSADTHAAVTPVLEGTTTVVDLNGGEVVPGDVLEYTIGILSSGTDAAIDARVRDQIPANTTYVAGSITPAVTGHYDAVNGRVEANVGVGATAVSGGQIAVGGSAQVSFRVQVASPLANGTIVSNQAVFDYAGAALGAGVRYTSLSDGDLATPGAQPTTIAVRSGPLLHATGAASYVDANANGALDAGEEVQWAVVLTNDGTDIAHGVEITDAIDPSSLVLLAEETTAGVIGEVGSTVHALIGDVAVGDAVTILIHARVVTPFPAAAGGQVTNQATVTAANAPTIDTAPTTLAVAASCTCQIDGACIPEGAVNPADRCSACRSATSTTTWTPDLTCTSTTDAGTDPTADGGPADAGVDDASADAGADGTDAGVSPDGAVMSDAGTSIPDAAVGMDAGVPLDPPGGGGGGCSCDTASGAPLDGVGALLLALGALLLQRGSTRRRR